MHIKRKIFITALISFLLASCTPRSERNPHVHIYEDIWSYNSEGHFHKCAYSGCSEISNIESHNFDNGVCAVCGYSLTKEQIEACSHEWYDWQIVELSTRYKDGLKLVKCKKCGKVTDVPIRFETNENYKWISTSEFHYIIDANTGNKISEGEPHEFVDYEGDTYVNIPPTCQNTGTSYKKCSVCGKIVAEEIEKLEHDFKEVYSSASCDQGGYSYQVCNSCGMEKTAAIPVTHHLVQTSTNKAGVTKYSCDRNNCNYAEYVLDIAEATGWNKPTVKMNGKEAPDNQSSWDVAGVIEDGFYDIQIEALMTYESHGDRYWYNMWETDTASTPDNAYEDPFRYYFKINDETVINPNVLDKNMRELGYLGANLSDSTPVFGDICKNVEITDATSFSLMHGNISYSMIISKVKLIKIVN